MKRPILDDYQRGYVHALLVCLPWVISCIWLAVTR